MFKKIQQSVVFIEKKTEVKPIAGIVLGSGLGNLTSNLDIEDQILYKDIPGFPTSTVEGHKGSLIFGRLENKPVVVMSGRFHNYEGYTAQEIVFPIRVLKFLGIKVLFLTNAAGSTNSALRIGDLMIIKDHISFFVPNPLTGNNSEELGPRFPDMSHPYDEELILKAKIVARNNNIEMKEGVYTCVPGPTYETDAEYKLVGMLGSDAVGMSTVQEVIAARHMGLRVFAISVITDLGLANSTEPISHNVVLKSAQAAEPKLSLIFSKLIRDL